MVQLGLNVDGQKPDAVKKPPETCEVPIPAKPQPRVAVRKGRCTKTVACVSVVSILIVLAVGATLLGVFLSRKHNYWRDCFFGKDPDDGGSHGEDSHGGWSHGGGSHGEHGGHGGHGGHDGHGGPGGHGDHDGGPGGHGDHDGGPGGHGGEDDDGGDRYPGPEGGHLPDGRP